MSHKFEIVPGASPICLLQNVHVAFRLSFVWTQFFKPNLSTLGTTRPSTLASMAHVSAHAYTGVIGSGSRTPIEVYFVFFRKKIK